jgi:peptidoglycan/xylan/chitin deacetylase (PgdA/CDA1 family)
VIGTAWAMVSAWSGLHRLARFRRRHTLLTVCYHNVRPADEIAPSFALRNTIAAADLRLQLEALARWFRVVDADAVLAASRGTPLPPRAALVTFDDGYAGWVDHARPLLLRLGLPATFFVTTGALQAEATPWYQELTWIVGGWRGERLPWPDGGERRFQPGQPRAIEGTLRRLNAICKRVPDPVRVAYLDRLRAGAWREPPAHERRALAPLAWDGARLLARDGFGIGSHTESHPILTRVDAAGLARELGGSRRRIEAELGQPCRWIAYPNGGPDDVSAAVFAGARAAGYELGFTTVGAFDRPEREPLAIGRVCLAPHLRGHRLHALLSGVATR